MRIIGSAHRGPSRIGVWGPYPVTAGVGGPAGPIGWPRRVTVANDLRRLSVDAESRVATVAYSPRRPYTESE